MPALLKGGWLFSKMAKHGRTVSRHTGGAYNLAKLARTAIGAYSSYRSTGNRMRTRYASEQSQNTAAASGMDTTSAPSGVVVAKKKKMSAKIIKKAKFAKRVQEANLTPVPTCLWVEQATASDGNPTVANTTGQQATWGSLGSTSTAALLWPGPRWRIESGAPLVPSYQIPQNIAVGTEGNTIIPFAPGLLENMKYHVGHHEIMHQIINSSNLAVQIEVWEFVAKQAINDRDYSTPLNAWITILADTDNPSGIAKTVVSHAGVNPLTCSGLGLWWKFLKKEEIMLNSNATTFRKMSMGPRTTTVAKNNLTDIVSGGFDVVNGEAPYAIAGWTKGIIIISRFDSLFNTTTSPIRVVSNRVTTYKPIYPSSFASSISQQTPVSVGGTAPLG